MNIWRQPPRAQQPARTVTALLPDVRIALTGVAATNAVGTLAPGTSAALTGNQITGAVGSVGQVRTNLFSASSFNVTADQLLSAYEGQINAIWTKHPDSSYTGDF